MKRKQRHQLKENALAQSIIAAREAIEARRKELRVTLIAIVVVAAVGGGFLALRAQSDSLAQALLADAMVTLNALVVPVTVDPAAPGEVPAAATLGAVGTYATEAAKLAAALPKLKTAADTYPDTEPGITARYHYAASLVALGRYPEAIEEFDAVIDRAGSDSLYGRMSRLGRADAQRQAGQLDVAIAAWRDLASSATDELPQDAILIELARALAAKGDTEEARKTFTQIVDEHPTSPYSVEARAELGGGS